ncbi:leucine-rich repeat-containing protein 2 [Bombina bombina]|uniref:leucine-rich repeat-containing protein 2 n=1 Tax=Bombina bombina TaxID=8345 RepID=UPI00235AB5FC|nr:leucine-rich repeat-containing protein 2 [Bombina bombina]XP_053558379.1 leucine-rich repeat-containing protein 2 [Bombina bombina]
MTFEVIVFDISQIRGLWETRVKKYKQKIKKEQERIESSALQKIKQEWSFMLECRNKGIPQAEYLKNGFVDTELNILETIKKNSHITKEGPPLKKKEEKAFIFELYGEDWEELPDYLKEKTHLKEWHVNKTRIQIIPAYIQMFQELKVLDISQNKITSLPPEIGCLENLKELNASFNNLKNIPPELGNCEKLEKLDLSANFDIEELPFELSNLKKVTFVDVSANKFSSIPICVLRMSSLQWFDTSGNNLKDLPQDIDRLEELKTLLLHKNELTYLPMELTNLCKLRLLVVSGESLVEIPSALVENPSLKYVKLLDSPIDGSLCSDVENKDENNRERQQFEKEFMKAYIKDLSERETTPSYTTKVSLSLQI